VLKSGHLVADTLCMGRTTHLLPCPDDGELPPVQPVPRPSLRVLKGEQVRLSADERSVITTEADLRSALDEALRRGFEQGVAAGAGRATDAARILVKALDQAQDAVAVRTRELLALDARLVVDLAVGLAEWFVGSTLAADPEALTHAIVTAIAELDTAEPLVLTVAESHVEFVKEHLGHTVGTIRADPTMGAGDFELTSSGPTIERRFTLAVERFTAELT
jgi:flagellar biosynthesis/type III secretory pathway protein FliH